MKSRTSRRSRWIGATALALACTALVIHFGGRNGADVVPLPHVGGSKEEPSPRLLSTGTQGKRAVQQPPPKTATGSQGHRVVCTVEDEAGRRVGAGRWYVWSRTGARADAVASDAVPANGTFEIVLPAEGGPITVSVWAPGFLPAAIDVPDTDRVRPASLRFVLARGASLRGRVLDADGEPVANVGLVARSRSGAVGNGRRINPEWGTDALRAPGRENVYYEGDARTNATGEFEIGGLAPGSYIVFSTDPAWVIDRPPSRVFVHVPLGEDLTLIARPARSVEVVLVPRVDMPAPARFRFELDCGPRLRFRGEGHGGRAEVAWRRSESAPEREDGHTGRLTVQAKGWKTESPSMTLEWPPQQARLRVEVPIRPVPVGRIQIHAATPTRVPITAPLFVRIRPLRDGAAVRSSVPLHVSEPGTWECEWSVGRWAVDLSFERGWFGAGRVWSGEVEVHEDRVTSIDVDVPSIGSLTVTRGKEAGALFLELRAVGARSQRMATLITAAALRIPAIPVGRYQLSLWRPDASGNVQGTKLIEREVVVEEGQTTSITPD